MYEEDETYGLIISYINRLEQEPTNFNVAFAEHPDLIQNNEIAVALFDGIHQVNRTNGLYNDDTRECSLEYLMVKRQLYHINKIPDYFVDPIPHLFLSLKDPYLTSQSRILRSRVKTLAECSSFAVASYFSNKQMLQRYSDIKNFYFACSNDMIVSMPDYFPDVHYGNVLRELYSFDFKEIKKFVVLCTSNAKTYYEGISICMRDCVVFMKQVGYLVIGKVYDRKEATLEHENDEENSKLQIYSVQVQVNQSKITKVSCSCNESRIHTVCKHIVACIVYRHVMKNFITIMMPLSERIDSMGENELKLKIRNLLNFVDLQYMLPLIQTIQKARHLRMEGHNNDGVEDITIDSNILGSWQYSSILEKFKVIVMQEFQIEKKQANEIFENSKLTQLKISYYTHVNNCINGNVVKSVFNLLKLAQNMLQKNDQNLIFLLCEMLTVLMGIREIPLSLMESYKLNKKFGCSYDFVAKNETKKKPLDQDDEIFWIKLCKQKNYYFCTWFIFENIFDLLKYKLHDPTLTKGFLVKLAMFFAKLHIRGWMTLKNGELTMSNDRNDLVNYKFPGFRHIISLITYRLKSTYNYDLLLTHSEEVFLSNDEKKMVKALKALFERSDTFSFSDNYCLHFGSCDCIPKIERNAIFAELKKHDIWYITRPDFFINYCNCFHYVNFKPRQSTELLIESLSSVNFITDLQDYTKFNHNSRQMNVGAKLLQVLGRRIEYMYKAVIVTCEKLVELKENDMLFKLVFAAMCVNRVYTFNNETELIHKHLQKKIETFLTTLERAKLLEYDYLSENNYLSVFDTIKKLRIAWEKNNSFWSIKTPYFAKRLLQFIMIPMVGNRQFYQKYPNVYSEIQKLVIAALKTSLNCNESKNSFLYESDRNERHDLYVFAVKYFEYDKLFLSIMTNVMFDLKYHRIHPAPFANGYQFIKNEKTIQNNVLYNHQQTHIASEDYIRSVFVLSNKLFIASGGRVSSQDIFRQDILEVMSILNPSLLTAATIALLYASGIDKAKKTFLKEKYTNYHAYYDISNSLLHEINANDGLVLNIISDCWEESLPVKDMINCILPSLHAYRNQSNVAIFEIIVSLMNSAYKLQDRIIQKLCNFVKENYSRQCYIKCLYKMYDSFDQHISKFKLNRNDTLIVIEQSNEFENVIAHNDLDVSISSDDYREAFVSEDLTFSFNRDNCESYKSLAYLSKELIIQYTIEDTAFYESEMTNKEMTTQAKRAINEIDFEYIGENDNYAILSQHNPVILYKYNNMPLDSLSKASILIVRSVHIHYKPRGSLVNDRFNIPIKKDLNNDYCGGSINFNPENSLSLIGVPISIEKKEMLNVALDAGFKSMVEYALKQKLDNACILKEMERSFNYDLIIHVLEIAVRMGPIAINRFLIVASKTIRSVGTLIEIQRIAMALINYRSICKYENMFPQIPKNQNNIDEDSENNEMVNTIDSREVLEDLREIPTNNEGICKDLAYCANISQVQSNVEKLPNNNSGDDDYKTSFLKEDWKKNFSLPTKPFPIPGILDGKEQIFDVLFKIPVTTELSNDIHKYCADLKTEIDLNHFNHYLLNSIFNTLAVRLTSKKRTSFLEDQIHWLWNYSAVMVNEVIGDTNSEYIQTKAHLSALYNNAKSLASIKIEALKLLKCAVVKQPFYIKP